MTHQIPELRVNGSPDRNKGLLGLWMGVELKAFSGLGQGKWRHCSREKTLVSCAWEACVFPKELCEILPEDPSRSVYGHPGRVHACQGQWVTVCSLGQVSIPHGGAEASRRTQVPFSLSEGSEWNQVQFEEGCGCCVELHVMSIGSLNSLI